jgi:hypothetical protein
MSVNSILVHFSAEKVFDCEKSIKILFNTIKTELEKYFDNLRLIFSRFSDGDYVWIFADETGVLITLRSFGGTLITLNIEYFKEQEEKEKFNFEVTIFIFFKLLHRLPNV